ncbi:helix-turn-helix transcriptional regulator [Rhizobium sp. CG5]|uniref:helix-turn-helix transcriptional regulator n=1 Tax=Rhizobium sp. CG5 TaxID=2726076 RepID=UPI002033B439|nr:AraC family transcriptional regulator [Rhizobium sp. CG5]MCM2474281.1 helix-turn-helix transcriptional regulator [Rhizobium sp. CG5]
MSLIRPLKFGSAALSDAEARVLCGSILIDMMGGLSVTLGAGDMSGLTGLYWHDPSLSLATVYFPKSVLSLTCEGSGDRGVVLLRSVGQSMEVEHRSARIAAISGDVVFVPAQSGLRITLPEGGRLDCAHLPEHAVERHRGTIEALMLKAVPAACLPLHMLTSYAGYLLQRDQQTAEDVAMMVSHFYDFLPLLSQAVGGAAQQSAPDSRMARIRALVDARLGDGGFSIKDVASAERITPRAIQKMFSREGTTFSRHLLERRLERAKAAMMAAGARMSIAEVAYQCGFNDLSYFNRSFRARYQIRPSDLKRQVRPSA